MIQYFWEWPGYGLRTNRKKSTLSPRKSTKTLLQSKWWINLEGVIYETNFVVRNFFYEYDFPRWHYAAKPRYGSGFEN